MSIVSDKEWFDLPYAAAAGRLVEMRTELRQKNLHDTEDPALQTPFLWTNQSCTWN